MPYFSQFQIVLQKPFQKRRCKERCIRCSRDLQKIASYILVKWYILKNRWLLFEKKLNEDNHNHIATIYFFASDVWAN
jgi:hypothetical protein